MMRFIYLLVSIPIIIIIATFAYRNAGLVNIDFFMAKFNMPLAAIILVSIFLGIILGFLFNIFVVIRQKNKIRQLHKQTQTMSGLSDFLKSDKQ
ncbi:MAG: LapA family protein [Gammaproteobacteria bacterium]|nr:LapA family protein [Gammaproteobacteria bacterium]